MRTLLREMSQSRDSSDLYTCLLLIRVDSEPYGRW